MPEDSSQNTALSPEDSSLVTDNHVTAAAEAADNATLTPTNEQQATADTQTGVDQPGSTGEGVDDSGTKTQAQKLSEYQEAKNALLSGKVTEPPAAPAAPHPTAPAPASAPAPAAAPELEEEFPSAPAAEGRMPQIKLRAVTPVDVVAMSEFKAHQKAGGKQSFVEFITTRYNPAALATGTAAPGTNGDATVQENPQTDQPPKTVAELDARLEQLFTDRYAALEGFDFEAAKAIEEKEKALRVQREGMAYSEKEQQVSAQQAWETQAAEYLAKAGTLYPQANTANDPLVLKASEVLNRWWNEGDPRAQHPSRELYCYVEAATELGISPHSAAPQATPPLKNSSTPSPVHRAPLTAIIASGAATHTQTREQVDTRTYEQRKADFLAATTPKGPVPQAA